MRALRLALRLGEILPQTEERAFRAGAGKGIWWSCVAALALSLAAAAVFAVVLLLVSGGGPGEALRLSVIAFVILSLVLCALFSWMGHKVGGVIGGLYNLYNILTKTVPKNFFGMCSGMRDEDTPEVDVLNEWLSHTIDEVAGLPAGKTPLTFGDLWGESSADERKIDLRMMTSNLSQSKPYILPFEENMFLFRESDLEKLFPLYVVKHMTKKARKFRGFGLASADFYFLPCAADLPVIFATRLSFSFPILIGMVRLYTISHNAFGDRRVRFEVEEKGKQGETVVLKEWNDSRGWEEITSDEPVVEDGYLQENWFSDGGICSNFPIHFFDAFLPRRPTFGINLTSQLARSKSRNREKEAADKSASSSLTEVSQNEGQNGSTIKEVVKSRTSYTALPSEATQVKLGAPDDLVRMYEDTVYLPGPNSEMGPEWIPIDGLLSFVTVMFDTARNYRDNMQAMLPSYRERIVQIRMGEDEGGLNLDMDNAVIKRVVDKGERAGDMLLNRFDFRKHQWVRFRVLMKQIEAGLTKMNRVMRDYQIYKDVIDRSRPFDISEFPFRVDDSKWLNEVRDRLEHLTELIESDWQGDAIFAREEYPTPDPVLRITPQV